MMLAKWFGLDSGKVIRWALAMGGFCYEVTNCTVLGAMMTSSSPTLKGCL